MKTAIMQPYFFPYLNYFQMFGAVDKFVLLDDVNFIMRGYINRNTILLNDKTYKFSIPLEKASQNKLINETYLNFSSKEKEKFLKTFQMSYKNAPYFKEFYPILEKIINFENNDLTLYLKNSFDELKIYLDLKTEILISSEIEKDNSLKAQDRIIELNKKIGSTTYINAIGGQKLYKYDDFNAVGMELKFIKMNDIKYKQFKNYFVPNLSFLDVLMFNSKHEIHDLLKEYTLV